MERYSYSDKAFLMIFISFALLSSFFLMNDQIIRNWSFKNAAFTNPLGQIISKENDVRVKMAKSPAWSSAQSGEIVHDQQMVFTGENSSAIVVLDSGTELNLGPNTLVLITKDKDLDQIELIKGKFDGNFKKAILKHNGKNVTLDSQKQTVELKNKLVTLAAIPKDKIITANPEFNFADKIKSDLDNQKADEVVAAPIIRELNLIEKPNSLYYIGKTGIKIPLAWEHSNAEGPYTITIARKHKGRVKMARINPKDLDRYTLKIKKEGTYKIYLQSKKAHKTRSDSYQFKIKSVLEEKVKLKKDFQKFEL